MSFKKTIIGLAIAYIIELIKELASIAIESDREDSFQSWEDEEDDT